MSLDGWREYQAQLRRQDVRVVVSNGRARRPVGGHATVALLVASLVLFALALAWTARTEHAREEADLGSVEVR